MSPVDNPAWANFLIRALIYFPVYVNKGSKRLIHGELAVTYLKNKTREAANQLDLRAGQDTHCHHFLNFAVVPTRQIRYLTF